SSNGTRPGKFQQEAIGTAARQQLPERGLRLRERGRKLDRLAFGSPFAGVEPIDLRPGTARLRAVTVSAGAPASSGRGPQLRVISRATCQEPGPSLQCNSAAVRPE